MFKAYNKEKLIKNNVILKSLKKDPLGISGVKLISKKRKQPIDPRDIFIEGPRTTGGKKGGRGMGKALRGGGKVMRG